MATSQMVEPRPVRIEAGEVQLDGDLSIPNGAAGVVLFAHGSGSSRLSRRNRFVAGELNHERIATLLMDLLTTEEEQVDQYTAHLRFDIPMLAERLVAAMDWLSRLDQTRAFPLGLFGASTGAAAALVAAAAKPELVKAVVSRGGRPDLAEDALERVVAPTLLIVGGEDDVVIDLNRQAQRRMRCEVQLKIIPGATHLFEEPGALEQVAALAEEWFSGKLARQSQRAER